MAVVFKNNANTVLASSITSSATSVSVLDGSVFPSLSAGEYFLCTIDDDTNNEIVKVTAISGNTLTVVRAQEGTTARAFSNSSTIESRVTAGIMDLFPQLDGGELTADEFIGDFRGSVLFKAQAGEALSKGDVVYISGISGNTTVVSKADADDAAKMPAFGIVAAAASLNNPVDVYTTGILSNIDTSSFSVGDELFVSNTPGSLTDTPPTGESSALQKIAKVTRSDANAGSIFITGAGRSNAVPNLNDGKIFLGNGSNQAVSTTLDTSVVPENTNLYYTDARVQAVSINNVVEDTSPQLGGNLDVNGYTITGSTVQINGATGELMISATENGPVALRYDNNLKLSTKSDGVNITGELECDSLDVDGNADITGNITISGTVDGRDLATDGTKLDGIESGATADQTASEILTLIKTVDGAGSGLDADTLDGISSASFLRSDADDTLSGNLTVTGNLTVQGTTVTLDATTLNVEDKNITLNYSTGDSSGSADGAGITIQDAVNSTTDATILWDATNDLFQFSHGAEVTSGNVKIGTGNDRFSYLTATTANLQIDGGVVFEPGSGNNVEIFNYRSTDMLFGNAGVEKMRLSSAGNLTLSGTVDGRDIASDGSKLDGIESGATADQTAAEILTAIKTVDGAGSGLDADLLDGQSSAYYQPASSALTTSTSFGGDVSGTYNAIVVADDSHNHIISNVDGLQAALDAKLASSSYTAADVLTKIKTVDGAGSGLDADLLDGLSSASFLRADTTDTATGTLNFATTNHALITVDTNGGTSGVADEFRIGADNYDTGTAFSGVTIRPSDNVNPDSGGTLLMVRSGGGSPRFFVQHSGILGSTNTDMYLATNTDMSGGDRVFHDGYHPNADKWTTARTITLGGDLTGNVSIDGSANVTLTAAVVDDSHNHIISNIDGLQTALDAKLASSSYTAADVLAKIKTVDGAGSGLDADLLDGISSASFLRSDAADTFTTLSGTQLNLGSQVQLKESSDRADLLEISSSTAGWAGLQIRNTSNEGRWSFMTDGAVAGIYDDENGNWHVYMTEAAGVELRHANATRFNTTSTGIDVSGNITLTGTVDGVDIAARDAVLTSTTTTANAALPKAGGTMTGNLTMSGASIYPATDNTGQVGNSTNTWNFGHFTNFQVDNTLTVRVYIDLADSDGIRWGSSDDYRMFYNGSTNYMNFEMEAANNGLVFTDNGTTRYTFAKAGTLSLDTNGNNSNGGNIRLGSTQNNATKFTSITSREYTNNTETEGFTIIGSVATTERSIIVGGGYLEQNAANNIKFYTTSGTARTGTEIARFTTNGLTFNGDTAAANALDDYEEGTWTPVNEGGTTGGASNLQGRYTKIGRMVYAHFSFETTGGVDTGLNYRVISGLPYVTYANSPIGQLGNCSMYNLDAYRSGYILNNSSGNNTEIFCAWNQTTSTGSLFRGFLIYETT